MFSESFFTDFAFPHHPSHTQERTPAPFVASTALALPSDDGRVQVTFEVTPFAALSQTKFEESASNILKVPSPFKSKLVQEIETLFTPPTSKSVKEALLNNRVFPLTPIPYEPTAVPAS